LHIAPDVICASITHRRKNHHVDPCSGVCAVIMSSSLPGLSFRVRADLYAQLAAMEKAGLPVDKAFGLLNVPAAVQMRLANARTFLKRGSDISAAGWRSGLFTELEATLIGAATSAGSPAATYRRLAEYYAQRAAQTNAMKSRLILPAFVLIISLLVQPLPALLAGTLGFGKYLLHILQPLAALTTIVYIVRSLPSRINRGETTPTTARIEKTIRALPLFGKIYIRRNVRDFFESLALMQACRFWMRCRKRLRPSPILRSDQTLLVSGCRLQTARR
jgi:general secretion pathway protein F